MENVKNDSELNLQGIIKSAEAIAKLLSDEADCNKLLANQTHLRPTAKGVSLVSIGKKTPQIRAKDIEFSCKVKFDSHQKSDPIEPKRSTPEKELQSWIIRDAYRNQGRMKSIEPIVKMKIIPVADVKVFFVTDEIGLVSGDTGKLIKCDILAVRKESEANGKVNWIPMQIELKSERKLDELIGQLEKYEKVFEKSRKAFETIYNILLNPVIGEKITFDASKLEKWILWPYAANPQQVTKEKISKNGINEIQYEGQFLLR